MTIMDDISTRTEAVLRAESSRVAHNYHPLDVVVATGAGAVLTDVDGTEYLDFLAAYSATNFGHGHPALVAAARAQLDRVTLTSRAFDPEGHELLCSQRSAFVPDPDNKLSPLFAGDSSVTQDTTVADKLPVQKEVDRRLVEARQEDDEQKRAELYTQLQTFLVEEQMVRAMLAYIFTPTATAANVAGFNADALGTYRLFLEKTGFSG